MRIFSGIQPTGMLHIGNYAGAISQWLNFQSDEKNSGFFCIVDLHALTSNPEPAKLHRDILETAAAYIALGVGNDRFPIFIQSHVSAHTELAWVLDTMTSLGELERMTQFKEKAHIKQKHIGALRESFRTHKVEHSSGSTAAVMSNLEPIIETYEDRERTNAGLLSYPVLMAADILLYDTDTVPVGDDQLQHVELTRDLARRFNKKYGETFTVPKAILAKTGSKIMSIQDPTRKMPKSLGGSHVLDIFEPEADIRKKIKTAVTDSGSEIKYDPEKKPAVSNLLTMLSIVSLQSVADLERDMKGMTYAALKDKLADEFVRFFSLAREKRDELLLDPYQISKSLVAGAQCARFVADKKIKEVRERIGLI